eukprot:gnl/MRDRNA2_/MRDRNA2_39325_c0_seq2.p1 gnl/MRDRNA2_/MRDRNA2_39325_c0~~gnl/MRDRNA2_/MRDRNA2_39325_c0_seq2.p1  ORF type:complete len:669 (+),score=151.13 gnl/MRDRNA2_/MRDRNA2_39325_c0_seq2:204-2009(+)
MTPVEKGDRVGQLEEAQSAESNAAEACALQQEAQLAESSAGEPGASQQAAENEAIQDESKTNMAAKAAKEERRELLLNQKLEAGELPDVSKLLDALEHEEEEQSKIRNLRHLSLFKGALARAARALFEDRDEQSLNDLLQFHWTDSRLRRALSDFYPEGGGVHRMVEVDKDSWIKDNGKALLEKLNAEEHAEAMGSFFKKLEVSFVVEQPWFNMFIAAMVFLTAMNMGLEVDLDLGLYGEACTHFLAVTWTVEVLLKIHCLGAREYFGERMNLLDFILAVFSVIDTWLVPLVLGGASGIRSVAILRMLRLVRLVRMVKLLRAFQELWLLIHGLVQALRVLVWVILLLLLLIYVGAILLTNTVGWNCDEPEYQDFEQCFMLYGTLLRSMLTLFEVVTAGPWDVARPVFERDPSFVIFFLGFVYLTTFGLMNIVAGVIFEQVLQTKEQNDEKLAQNMLDQERKELQLVRQVLAAADKEQSGLIALDEWLATCEEEAVQKILANLGLNVSRKRLAHRLYEVVDADRTGAVNLDEMLKRIFQLKTEGMMQNKDMTLLLMDVRHQGRRLERVEDKLNKISHEAMSRHEDLLSRGITLDRMEDNIID